MIYRAVMSDFVFGEGRGYLLSPRIARRLLGFARRLLADMTIFGTSRPASNRAPFVIDIIISASFVEENINLIHQWKRTVLSKLLAPTWSDSLCVRFTTLIKKLDRYSYRNKQDEDIFNTAMSNSKNSYRFCDKVHKRNLDTSTHCLPSQA